MFNYVFTSDKHMFDMKGFDDKIHSITCLWSTLYFGNDDAFLLIRKYRRNVFSVLDAW